MGPIFWLSMRQLGGRWRLAIILLLAALPVGLAVLGATVGQEDTNAEPDSYEDFVNIMVDGLLVAAIMPIVTMALSTAVFGNELEDRTLSYLVLKPIPRWRIALPKLLASMVIGVPLLVVSWAVSSLLVLDVPVRAAAAVGVGLSAGVATYAAIFTWAGLMTTRALPFALLYVFLWEGLIGSFIRGVDYLSVRGYTLAIMHGIDETGLSALSPRVIEFPAAVVGAVAVTLAFFWLTVRRLKRMDVP